MVGPRPRIPRFSGKRQGANGKPSAAEGRGESQSVDAGESAPASHARYSGGGSSTVTAPTPAHSFNGRLIALIVVATLILFLAAPTAKIFFDQRAQITALEESIAAKEQEQQQLKLQEERWGDDAYVEQQARERMFYVMPGERAYLVLGAEETGRQAAESSAEQVEAGKPAWADGLWQSVVDSAFPPSEPEIAPVEPEQ
ncbi:septum formation initiator family protein [Kocuria sp. cx-455]|uniref:FtsB family cell division protein n=1 Tax=unclassified Candidatus Sulfotelmatobacter TaxID=2635724 RepID=UPI0016859534|nr:MULTISPECIES: septum formation initiator family protein [unclassified Candidatus Sulfotelmatobacter]MBD2762789.1 septum formation initiator family protein [Kocuria sp. cx-116]MBD2765162.1 septum formation initiator family protein [Kocuria sp. cx-455]